MEQACLGITYGSNAWTGAARASPPWSIHHSEPYVWLRGMLRGVRVPEFNNPAQKNSEIRLESLIAQQATSSQDWPRHPNKETQHHSPYSSIPATPQSSAAADLVDAIPNKSWLTSGRLLNLKL